MDEQLLIIVEQLEKHKINYWLDSGTLLGLVRDGKLIEGDNDIDISVLETEVNKLNDLIINNMSLKKFYFNGKCFKVNLMPTTNNFNLKIDINVFYKKDDFFWCFQPIGKKINNKFVRKIVTKITESYLKIGKNI